MAAAAVDAARDFRAGSAVLFGRPNVGKSSLQNALVGRKISITAHRAQTTRHILRGARVDDDSRTVFVDSPGWQNARGGLLNARLNRGAENALRAADVSLFVLAAPRPIDPDWRALDLLPPDKPALALLNKIDLVADKSQLFSVAEALAARRDFCAVVPVSARRGTNLDIVAAEIKKQLPSADSDSAADAADADELTESFLFAERLREKLCRHLGDELPYAAAARILQIRRNGRALIVDAEIAVERDSQRAILLGKNGVRMRRLASAARIEIEELARAPVFLTVAVRVRKNWRADARLLATFGCGRAAR